MYNFIIVIIYILLLPVSIFSTKIRIWIKEQYLLFNKLKESKVSTIWFHCASAGEYQQIKPLINHYQMYKKKIIITFFSNSGYDNFQDFNTIEHVTYLPLDLSFLMKIFVDKINPELVFIAKNELWPNMLNILNAKNIPIYLISFRLNKNKMNNILTRNFYKTQLAKFNKVFVQDVFSHDLLKKYHIYNTKIIGDLRVNQIITDSQLKLENKKLDQILSKKKIIVYGSIEKKDCNVIMKSVNSINDLIHIIIPHNSNDQSIFQILKTKLSKNIILYSKHTDQKITNKDVLIIDQYGLLKKIYSYSTISYIGGGFDKGIHNTLEAAIYKNFIIFGPIYKDFPEATGLINEKIGFSITNNNQLKTKITELARISQNQHLDTQISAFFKKREVDLNLIINEIG